MPQSFDIERLIREHCAYVAKQEQIMQDWLLLTGESIDSEDLHQLYRDWGYVNGTRMSSDNFERLKLSLLLLTRNMDPADLIQLTQALTTKDLENLRKNYLVLNWMKMSWKDFEVLKENWLKIAAITGVDNGEDVIKKWLLGLVLQIDYSCQLNQKDKVDYIKMCLERGADVKAVRRGGYSLLHMIGSNDAHLMEVLLSFGADVTLRNPGTKETPLEQVRTRYYKEYEDAVCLLQTAEKSAKKNALLNRSIIQEEVPNNNLCGMSAKYSLDEKIVSELSKLFKGPTVGEKQKWTVESSQPPYLTRLTELFDLVELDIIGSLAVRVINYMYISRVIKTELKFKNHADRNEKIRKMHRVFSRVCTKLFNLFDPKFDRSVNVEFGGRAVISDTADLVFLVDIDPAVEWVAVKMFAVPWDMEYFVCCKTSSIARFKLFQNVWNPATYSMADLIYPYVPYMSEYQRRLIKNN